MASSVKVTVKRVYGRLPHGFDFQTALSRARGEMQEFVLTDAKRRALDAVKSGEYINSIDATGFGSQGFTLHSSVPQAWWLEYGTGIYGPKKRPYPIDPLEGRAFVNFLEYLEGKRRRIATGTWPEGFRKTPHSYLKWHAHGEDIFALHVTAPGMPAEPNLGPAIFENIDAQEEMIARNVIGAFG